MDLPDSAESLRQAFESALGKKFGQCVCPPVPRREATRRECCEVIALVLGDGMTPARLSALTGAQVLALAVAFGAYFKSPPPSVAQIEQAIARTLDEWPIGSLGETY